MWNMLPDLEIVYDSSLRLFCKCVLLKLFFIRKEHIFFTVFLLKLLY